MPFSLIMMSWQYFWTPLNRWWWLEISQERSLRSLPSFFFFFFWNTSMVFSLLRTQDIKVRPAVYHIFFTSFHNRDLEEVQRTCKWNNFFSLRIFSLWSKLAIQRLILNLDHLILDGSWLEDHFETNVHFSRTLSKKFNFEVPNWENSIFSGMKLRFIHWLGWCCKENWKKTIESRKSRAENFMLKRKPRKVYEMISVFVKFVLNEPWWVLRDSNKFEAIWSSIEGVID